MVEPSVRWGLLSTARINERLMPAFRETARSELVGIASRDSAKATAYANQYGIPNAYGSYEAMLHDPQIDAVYISLPNGFHEEWTVKAADAGKHVLCEKPLALTVGEVDSMAAAARRNGVIVQEAAMYRFHPQTQKLRQMIAEGAIGEVRFIQATFCFTLMNQADVRLDPALGGGALWDIGSYPVSFARTMIGANPTDVVAFQTESDRGVDLSLCGQMRFPGDDVAQFACSFQSVPHWGAEIIGSKGRITLDIPWTHQPGKESHARVTSSGGPTKATFGDSTDHLRDTTFTFEARGAYHYQIESMVASIRDGAAPMISLDDSRGNVQTLVALYESAREGRIVKLQ